MRYLLLFFTLMFSGIAMAEDGDSAIQYKAKTEIDFEAVELEGKLRKPQGDIIIESARANFNPMVQIREEWNKEMLKSVDQVQ